MVSPCCFADSSWRGWGTSPAPPHPVIPATPLLAVPSPPAPSRRGYSQFGLPASSGRRSGWGRQGEEVCAVGKVGAPLNGRWEPRELPGAPRALAAVWAAAGRSRAASPSALPPDPKPQGPRYRPSRPRKPAVRGARVLLGVFTPKGLCWDISSIFGYFLRASPCSAAPAAAALFLLLPPPSLPHSPLPPLNGGP